MEDRLAEKLRTSMNALELPNVERGTAPSSQSHQSDPYDDDGDDMWCEDGSLCDSFGDGLGKTSDLNREWARRHGQFHTIGYRDGLIAGKETSAQEGFNVGFKQSVLTGYNWGLVRGITSAFICLPDHLKEKVVGTLEKRDGLQNLYESVHSVSTKQALKLFHDDILGGDSGAPHMLSEGNLLAQNMADENSGCNQLEKFSRELDSLLESTEVKVHSEVDQQIVE
eukprot:TRINITY_DN1135_c0_g1_i1.p1 TRINITY_DN1135_c0_g1~~TRINITY_DN1135_c0_g1_i1.p1  ORF type:complete len:259 (-),score=44.71 TRINITY_DN1135_c0_g1_i1:52-726(-)